jgi:hypothetical protein
MPEHTAPHRQPREPTAPAAQGLALTGWLLMLMITLQIEARTALARLPARQQSDAGSPTVETIGWVSFSLVMVVLLGKVLKGRLTAFANSLPTTLGW